MLELLEAVGQVVASLLAAAMITIAAFGIGSALLRALRLETHGIAERATWSVTLGLVCGGMLLALLGLLGLLYAPLVGVLSVLGTACGSRQPVSHVAGVDFRNTDRRCTARLMSANLSLVRPIGCARRSPFWR